ncbi:ATP-binding cassette domain-containing protein [Acidianus sulfidivorans JP7]|uniref:Dipeptide/oligopeptide/nickel ABC transporter ATP-binding protein n=1 Tax=Acidianus sulfidivorans JP7 TaxID=619593 RepID=A0A2U9ILK8_9CREN|nr:ABC transporter ATP-binding protein [Acidianus sulfidivorans]AWR96893.1 ATP-binding cassette domain-containing protein [Acidianus sulfidivorans JP7]
MFEEVTQNPILEVKNLSVHFYSKNREVKAVEDVSFVLEKGKVLGVAGESGSGKSTLAKAIFRILPPNGRILKGEIIYKGNNILTYDNKRLQKEIRWKSIAYVPQVSMNSLDPVFKVKDQMLETIFAHEDVSKAEALERIQNAITSVGLPSDIIDRFPHELSGGQKQRVMIAMSMLLNPELLIADEPTTALDVIVQAQILDTIKNIQREKNLSMMFITHDLALLAEISNMMAIMYAGRIVEFGKAEDIYYNPLHPYTQLLLKAIPSIKDRKKKLVSIPGDVPDLSNPPPGCPFNPRCPLAGDICRRETPELTRINGSHYVACFMVGKNA